MSFSAFDHQCMAEALRLASMGMFTTQPNPRVGCVLARDGQVVGKGFHRRAGEAHAEVLAIADAGEAARGATAYVTLEPCSHQGRTPPCSSALISAGISRVVMAMEDPHEVVNGAGRSMLLKAGLDVEHGLMQAEARELNPGFIMRVSQGRPFVRIKLAASMDGRTALASGESQWITGAEARQDVQRYRARSSAILSGIGTVLADDPRLTVRLQDQAEQPLRVIADTHWRTPVNSRILQQPGRVIIAGSDQHPVPEPLKKSGAHCCPLPEVDGKLDLQALMDELARQEVNELHVEAGSCLSGALLRSGLADEILLYQAPVIMGDDGAGLFAGLGIAAMSRKVNLQLLESRFVGLDQRLRFRPVYPETEES